MSGNICVCLLTYLFVFPSKSHEDLFLRQLKVLVLSLLVFGFIVILSVAFTALRLENNSSLFVSGFFAFAFYI